MHHRNKIHVTEMIECIQYPIFIGSNVKTSVLYNVLYRNSKHRGDVDAVLDCMNRISMQACSAVIHMTSDIQ